MPSEGECCKCNAWIAAHSDSELKKCRECRFWLTAAKPAGKRQPTKTVAEDCQTGQPQRLVGVAFDWQQISLDSAGYFNHLAGTPISRSPRFLWNQLGFQIFTFSVWKCFWFELVQTLNAKTSNAKLSRIKKTIICWLTLLIAFN